MSIVSLQGCRVRWRFLRAAQHRARQGVVAKFARSTDSSLLRESFDAWHKNTLQEQRRSVELQKQKTDADITAQQSTAAKSTALALAQSNGAVYLRTVYVRRERRT